MTEEKFRYYIAQIRKAVVVRAAAQETELALQASQHRAPEDMRAHLEKAQQWLAEYDRSSVKKIIRAFDDIPDPLTDDDEDDVAWFVTGIIAKGEVTVISGAPGAGKSWLALALYGAAVMGGTWLGCEVRRMPVLYIDRENSKGTLKARIRIIAQGPGLLKPWGKWLDPPILGDPRLMEFAKQRCVLIFDSLIRFHTAESENDAAEMAAVMNQLKELAGAGATVVVIHHAGKNGISRGSSEITAGCDAALTLTKRKGGILELKAEKHRDVADFTIKIHADFKTGRFEAVDFPALQECQAEVAAIRDIINSEPGLTSAKIANKMHMRRARVFEILDTFADREWKYENGARGSKVYYPMQHDNQFPRLN